MGGSICWILEEVWNGRVQVVGYVIYIYPIKRCYTIDIKSRGWAYRSGQVPGRFEGWELNFMFLFMNWGVESSREAGFGLWV